MKTSSNTKLILTIVLFILSKALLAQVDTIRLQDKRLNTAVLKPGLNQYLVYFQTPSANKNLRFWFWLRDIKRDTRSGEKVFAITQHWYGSDTSAYRYVYSINKQQILRRFITKKLLGVKRTLITGQKSK